MDTETTRDTVTPIVGHTYRTRHGGTAVIEQQLDPSSDGEPLLFPYVGTVTEPNGTERHESWAPRGTVWTDGPDDDRDLVEYLGRPITAAERVVLDDMFDGPDPTPLVELLDLVDATNASCRDIMVRKNHDYTSGSQDVLANFRASETIGVHPGLGILIRSMDKFKRIQTFIEQGTLEVNSESVQDAVSDVINYMHLLNFLLQEDK